MKTYWDHTPRERAEMTEDVVRGLLDAHLMERGVLRVAAPVIKKLKQVPELKRQTVWVVCVKGQYGAETQIAAFDTPERAHKFVELQPMTVAYDYSLGSDRYYAEPIIEAFVQKKEFMDRVDLMNNKALFDENKAIESENAGAEKGYREAAKAMNSCLGEVWEDWGNQRALDSQHRQVAHTFEEYKATAQGDEETAAKFLLKVFPGQKIKEASEWLGISIPTAFENAAAKAEPAEEVAF